MLIHPQTVWLEALPARAHHKLRLDLTSPNWGRSIPSGVWRNQIGLYIPDEYHEHQVPIELTQQLVETNILLA